MPESHGLDREARCRLIAYAHGWNATHREPGQHKGPITRAYMEVLKALLFGFANSKTGSCFPSYEAIAAKADVGRSTVYEAIKVLERAGVMRIVNRLTRVGGRVLRTSNAYVFRDIAPQSENRSGNRNLKESVDSNVPPRVKVIVLDPRNPLDAALIGLGKAAGSLPATP